MNGIPAVRIQMLKEVLRTIQKTVLSHCSMLNPLSLVRKKNFAIGFVAFLLT